MKVIVAENYADACSQAANIIETIVREKPDCCLGLATGSSPVGMYKELARRCREEGLDFSQVSSVNLDEYVGLSGEITIKATAILWTAIFLIISILIRQTPMLPRESAILRKMFASSTQFWTAGRSMFRFSA